MLDVNKTKIEELNQRLSKLETDNNIEMLTLVEILANAAFFGKLKEENCHFAKNGQCFFFILSRENKNKVPLVSHCKITKCPEPLPHFHIETSAITCSLCNQMIDKSTPTQNKEKRNTSGRKKI
jgi:hypothetical protein